MKMKNLSHITPDSQTKVIVLLRDLHNGVHAVNFVDLEKTNFNC